MAYTNYYKLEGNSNDYSGNGKNGTDTSVSYVPGKRGQGALGVDSTTGTTHATVTSPGCPLTSANRSFGCWARMITNANGDGLMGWGGWGTPGYFCGLLWSATHLAFAGYSADVTGNATVSGGQTVHAVVTYDGTTIRLYRNGVLDNSGAVTLNTQASDLEILRRKTNADPVYGGAAAVLDNVFVDNSVFTAQKIKTVYASESGRLQC